VFQGFIAAFFLTDLIRSLSCVLRLAQRSGWHLIPLTDWRTGSLHHTASLHLSLPFCRYSSGNRAVILTRCPDVIAIAIPLV